MPAMNLSETEPLQVMLSSRASDKIMFEGKLQGLSGPRRAIKAQLESLKIGDVSFPKCGSMKTMHFSLAMLIRGKNAWKRLATPIL